MIRLDTMLHVRQKFRAYRRLRMQQSAMSVGGLGSRTDRLPKLTAASNITRSSEIGLRNLRILDYWYSTFRGKAA
jgi:hypothetical protein